MKERKRLTLQHRQTIPTVGFPTTSFLTSPTGLFTLVCRKPSNPPQIASRCYLRILVPPHRLNLLPRHPTPQNPHCNGPSLTVTILAIPRSHTQSLITVLGTLAILYCRAFFRMSA